jgi:hypothetical protein
MTRLQFLITCSVIALAASVRSQASVAIGQNFIASTSLGEPHSAVDTMGAVGVDHFVEMINGRYSVFRKSDHFNEGSLTLSQFWNGAFANTGSLGTTTSGDSRILFDHGSGRWFALGQDHAGGTMFLGGSQGSDPRIQSGGAVPWNGFQVGGGVDQPRLGVNADGVFAAAKVPIPLEGEDGETSLLISFRKQPLVTSGLINGSTNFDQVLVQENRRGSEVHVLRRHRPRRARSMTTIALTSGLIITSLAGSTATRITATPPSGFRITF